MEIGLVAFGAPIGVTGSKRGRFSECWVCPLSLSDAELSRRSIRGAGHLAGLGPFMTLLGKQSWQKDSTKVFFENRETKIAIISSRCSIFSINGKTQHLICSTKFICSHIIVIS